MSTYLDLEVSDFPSQNRTKPIVVYNNKIINNKQMSYKYNIYIYIYIYIYSYMC